MQSFKFLASLCGWILPDRKRRRQGFLRRGPYVRGAWTCILDKIKCYDGSLRLDPMFILSKI